MKQTLNQSLSEPRKTSMEEFTKEKFLEKSLDEFIREILRGIFDGVSEIPGLLLLALNGTLGKIRES